MDINSFASNCLLKIREKAPLIHNITNFVVMNPSANILLSLGASPVMAHYEGEIEEMVELSDSLVLNIGTLDNNLVKSMKRATKIANQLGKPVTLDIVGAGATKFRTKTALDLIGEHQISILRGNASEIYSLTSSEIKTKGVDSSIGISDQLIKIARKIALDKNCVVGISGPTDIVTNGKSVAKITNGHPIMTKITGIGCGLTAFTGAYVSVSKDKYLSTVAAFAHYGICGNIAAKCCKDKPGSFFASFIDTIYNANSSKLSELIEVNITDQDL